MKNRIRLLALQNAVAYGTADMGKVLAKIIAEFPEVRTKISEVKELVLSIVKEVNQMRMDQQQAELEKKAPELLEKKKGEKREGLKELHNAKQGSVVMRFEPSPSGPLHIGHAYVAMLNYEYCRMYNGKLILRISDTNPDNIAPESYEMIPENMAWLCPGIVLEQHVQSDRMESYYKYGLLLVEKGHAYLCECDSEEAKKMISKGEECPCRNLSPAEHTNRWHKLFDPVSGYAEGDAVVKLKTNVQDKNPAMRDFAILRINETDHARQRKKYRVWPMMNFAVAIDDHDMGLTHVLRGKDHYDNTKRQKWIFDYLRWPVPEYLHIGRINFEGLAVSCSETRKAIEEGTYTGWDDIRIPFINALRRRGYRQEAFLKYAISQGVTMTDKTVSAGEFFKAINAYNRETIERQSMRYFFIEDPVEVVVHHAKVRDVELDLHPDHKKGGRRFKTSDRFYLAKQDMAAIADKDIIRLMDCLNAVKRGSYEEFEFHSQDVETYRKCGKRIIHWLPKEGRHVTVEVAMDDGSVKHGFGEEGMRKLTPGDMVQLERFGYCRVDAVEKDTIRFWWAHR